MSMSENQPPERKEFQAISIDGVDAETVANLDAEAIVSNNPLVELLTPRAKVKILVTLIRLHGEKISPSGICDRAAISTHMWYEHYEVLLQYGVIEKVGAEGNSPFYRANMDSQIIQSLEEIISHGAKKKQEWEMDSSD
jgi:predicted transcriptional regulator